MVSPTEHDSQPDRDPAESDEALMQRAIDLVNAYLSKWSDPDIGDPLDDFVGVDSTIDLGYAYNGTQKDAVYAPPPAMGYDLLQGPIVPSPGDSARRSRSPAPPRVAGSNDKTRSPGMRPAARREPKRPADTSSTNRNQAV